MKDRIDAILQRTQAEYLLGTLPEPDPLLAEMERVASEEGQPIADPELAQLLRVLVRLRRPRRVLEVGTNIGYAVIAMGREMDRGAVLETIELKADILARARDFVRRAALGVEVVFHHGAALEVMAKLEGELDLVYIDAVKEEYVGYLDLALPRLAPGGVVVADNVLWKGKVAEGATDSMTEGLRQFNERIMNEPRLVSTILPVGDGASLSVRV
ncbi:MAG: O-methyltransferase [Thermoanaerobaculia bacterium]